MKTLAQWLQNRLNARGLTQQTVSVRVSTSTFSQMLNQDHVPRIETLFRLAGYLDIPRDQILRIAARMPIGEEDPHHDPDPATGYWRCL